MWSIYFEIENFLPTFLFVQKSFNEHTTLDDNFLEIEKIMVKNLHIFCFTTDWKL